MNEHPGESCDCTECALRRALERSQARVTELVLVVNDAWLALGHSVEPSDSIGLGNTIRKLRQTTNPRRDEA